MSPSWHWVQYCQQLVRNIPCVMHTGCFMLLCSSVIMWPRCMCEITVISLSFSLPLYAYYWPCSLTIKNLFLKERENVKPHSVSLFIWAVGIILKFCCVFVFEILPFWHLSCMKHCTRFLWLFNAFLCRTTSWWWRRLCCAWRSAETQRCWPPDHRMERWKYGAFRLGSVCVVLRRHMWKGWPACSSHVITVRCSVLHSIQLSGVYRMLEEE